MFDGIYTPGCVCSYWQRQPGSRLPALLRRQGQIKSYHLLHSRQLLHSRDPIVLEIVILAGFNFVVFQQAVWIQGHQC